MNALIYIIISIRQKTKCEFSAYVAFNKATNGQRDRYIKHEKEQEKKRSRVSLLKIAVENKSGVVFFLFFLSLSQGGGGGGGGGGGILTRDTGV